MRTAGRFEESLIADNWRVLSEQQIEDHVMALLSTRASQVTPARAPAATLSRSERYALLMGGKLKLVAELASQTQQGYEVAEKEAEALIQQLYGGAARDAVPAPTTTRKRRADARAGAQAEVELPLVANPPTFDKKAGPKRQKRGAPAAGPTSKGAKTKGKE